jgi:outer membrane protein assembly factor BamB
MASYVPTLLGKDKYVFMFSDRGIGSCLEAATGNILWQQRLGGNFSGSPICVGKNIYCIDEDGTVVVIAAAPEFKLLGKTPLGEECRSTPAVAGGRMYLRTASHLMSLGGKKK